MKEVFHLIYILMLIVFMTLFGMYENVCGVCFIGFLLINARLNEREEK